MLKIKLVKLLILLCLTVFITTSHKRNLTEGLKNNTEKKLSDFIHNTTLIGSIIEKWNNFTNSIFNMFSSKPQEKKFDINQHVSEFNRQIADFLNQKMPSGNFTNFLDIFTDKLTEYINITKLNEDTQKEYLTKYFGITENVTEFLRHGLFEKSDNFSQISEKLENLMDKISGYFNSTNYTNFTDYVDDWTKGVFDTEKPFRNYVYYYYETYFYPKEYQKFSNCNSQELDRCGHKCKEKNHVLCGCYKNIKNENLVDCVCADSIVMCKIKHYHNQAEPKKDM
jgi:hypothetical protein